MRHNCGNPVSKKHKGHHQKNLLDLCVRAEDHQRVIYESGIDRGSFGTYAASDRLRIAVEGGVVKYYRNNALVYTSTVAPTYPLQVDVSMNTVWSPISNVTIAGASLTANPVNYVLQDVQGSTRAVMSGTSVVARHDFLPFGEELGAGTGLRTTGQGYGIIDRIRQRYAMTERDDAAGLDHTWWRKYENLSGRWTSPDPYLGSMSIVNPQSFNRYAYVQNDPVNFIDPSGLDICYDDPADPWQTVCIPDITASVDINISAEGGFGGLGGGRGVRTDDPDNEGRAGGGVPQNPSDPPKLNDCAKNFLSQFYGYDRSLLDSITYSTDGIPGYVPIDARAFTLFDHIYFKKNEFNPDDGISDGEMTLLAHEIRHSRQYRQSGRLRMAGSYLLQSGVQGIGGYYFGGVAVASVLSYYGNEYEQDALDIEKLIERHLARFGNPCR